MASHRLTVKYLSGTQLEFEGELESCIAFAERFLAGEVEVSPAPVSKQSGQKRASRGNAIGIREMRAALRDANPRNDAQRVAVIVAVAHKHEQTPVDIAFLRDWFQKLDLREPSAMSATVANARKDGLVTSVAYGRFAPTARARLLIGQSAENVVQMPRRTG